MSVTILATATALERDVYIDEVELNGTYMTVPFMGLQEHGPESVLGFGFFYYLPGSESPNFCFEGDREAPYYLIQNWRSMHVLDLLPEYDENTLTRCWNAATANLKLGDLHRSIRTPWGVKDTCAIRATVLSMEPTQSDVDEMLALAAKLHSPISQEELQHTRRPLGQKRELYGKLLTLHEPPWEPSEQTTLIVSRSSLPYRRVRQ